MREESSRGGRQIAVRIALLLVLLISCAAELPLVERFDEGAWQPEPFRVTSLGGQRGGARIEFVLRLEDPAGCRLVVQGVVEIDPQATLMDGSWVEERQTPSGTERRSGALSSATVDFFGGQGGRPSLGGQLTLSAVGAKAYRINLPATPLTAER